MNAGFVLDNSFFIWIVTAAITFHNIEEVIWLPAWSQKKTDKWRRPVDASEFRFAVTVLTVLLFVIALLATIFGTTSIWNYLFAAYALGQSLNILMPHLITTIVTRKYAPGLLTGLLFVWPLSISYLYDVFTVGQLEWGYFLLVSVIFIPIVLLSIPLLFRLKRTIRGIQRS